MTAKQWFKVTEKGLYCLPGDFYIDPIAPVSRAVITHGHSDHALPGHNEVIAHPMTCAIMGYLQPIYLHEGLRKMCDLYTQFGIELGELPSASTLTKDTAAGALILCPPSALHDRWSRRFAEPVVAMASGWMHIRARGL